MVRTRTLGRLHSGVALAAALILVSCSAGGGSRSATSAPVVHAKTDAGGAASVSTEDRSTPAGDATVARHAMRQSPLVSPDSEWRQSALPGVIARLPLTAESHRILDFRRDPTTRRLFVTTTEGRLLVLDDESFTTILELPFGGELMLDSDERRLYVGPGSQFVVGSDPIAVHVIDLDSLSLIGKLDGVHAVSFDRVNRRLFAGSPMRPADDERGARSIRVFDLDTLALIDELDYRGIPAYNSLRNELVLAAYTALVIDPDSGDLLGDLLPELAEQPFPWCNGCEYVRRVHVLEPQGQVVIERTKFSTGGGPGLSLPDLYLDAASLEAINSFAELRPFQPACSTLRIPIPPIADLTLWQQHFVRTVAYRNLDVHESDGARRTLCRLHQSPYCPGLCLAGLCPGPRLTNADWALAGVLPAGRGR